MDEALNGSALDKSGHTTGRKSAPITRVEVITRGERRRAWTLDQKREIVAESLAAELSATEVARKYGIRTGQLYTWRPERGDHAHRAAVRRGGADGSGAGA